MILTKDQCPTTPSELQAMSGNTYWEPIGSLQYVVFAAQLDISVTISKLAQLLVNPAQVHLHGAVPWRTKR